MVVPNCGGVFCARFRRTCTFGEMPEANVLCFSCERRRILEYTSLTVKFCYNYQVFEYTAYCTTVFWYLRHMTWSPDALQEVAPIHHEAQWTHQLTKLYLNCDEMNADFELRSVIFNIQEVMEVIEGKCLKRFVDYLARIPQATTEVQRFCYSVSITEFLGQ